MGKRRIAILDGFRAVAILSVVVYHFAQNILKYGSTGVQFFFIISGFVIFLTLEKTTKFSTFWKNRFIRLYPSMVVASLLTFTIFNFFDHNFLFPGSHVFRNLLPTFLFLNPSFFTYFFRYANISFDYIDYSYWTLWVEIQFYLFCSILFYFNKVNFIRNFIISSIILILINYLFKNIQGNNILNISITSKAVSICLFFIKNVINIISYLSFFCTGMLFYILYKNKHNKIVTPLFIKISLVFFAISSIASGLVMQECLIYTLMIVLFYCFIYFPEKLLIFENKYLTNIGESSYFLYLIHQNIGLLIIFLLTPYFYGFEILIKLALIGTLIYFSRLFTNKIDLKINNWLKAKWMGSKER